MATAATFAKWIRDNADKKGTQEFQIVEAAMRKMIAQENEVSVDPTEGMTGGQKFRAGAGKAVSDLGRGALQVLGPAKGVFLPDSGVANSRERDKALMGTGAGMAGNITGNIAAAIPTAFIPGINTYKGAALAGAGFGALSPTTEDESRLKKAALGAALGVGTKGTLDAAGWAGRKAKDAASTYLGSGRGAASRALVDAAGDRSDDIIAALRNADPTFSPTAGQAAAPAGSAEFSALQKIAEQADPSKYVGIQRAQNAARLAPIRAIAGGSKGIATATGKRAANAAKNYPSGKAVVPPEVKKILSTDVGKKALREAKKLADVDDIPSDDIQFYQLVKESLSDLATKAGKSKPKKARILGGVEKRFSEAFGKANPSWARARDAYARDSAPINQMQVGKELEKALSPALGDFSDEVITQRPTVLANALRNAPQTIKRATGQPRFNSIDEILSPQQSAKVSQVAKSLANDADFAQLAKAGMRQASGVLDDVKPGTLPGILERNVVIANSILGRTGKRSGEKIVKYLADNMDDPQKIAAIMEKASPKEKSAIAAVLRNMKNAAPAASAALAE